MVLIYTLAYLEDFHDPIFEYSGLGPIFGAIMGAKFGVASFLWIVLGSIFAGATHDSYLECFRCGMMEKVFLN